MITVAQLGHRLLDGPYRWGTTTRGRGRYGARSIHLRILPPDSTRNDRRVARAARLWPGIGAALIALKLGVAHVSPAISYLVALVVGTAVATGAGLLLRNRSAAVRARTVELIGWVSLLAPRTADSERYEVVDRFAGELHTAERDLEDGELAWPEYQHVWGDVYARARAV